MEDGRVARVADELTEEASTPGKVERVLGDVVGEVGETSVLPTFSQGCLALLLWREGEREGGRERRW